MPRSASIVPLNSGADRLIAAARELFAARGYDGVSVRDIVRRAGTNLNSINYYFGSKQGLYVEVLRREHAHAAAEARRAAQSDSTASDAPARLRELIERMLRLFLDHDTLLPRLAALEIVNPSPAFDEIAPAMHALEQQELTDIVQVLLGDAATDGALVRDCVRSVLSQCAYYMFTAAVQGRMASIGRMDAESISPLAAHIAEFSLHALDGLRRRAMEHEKG